MPELSSSQRRFLKATYQPAQSIPNADGNSQQAGDTQQPSPTRAVEKASFVQSLAIRQPELSNLQTRVQPHADLTDTMSAITQVVNDSSPVAVIRNAQSFLAISVGSLLEFGQILTQSRQARITEVQDILQQIVSEYASAAPSDGQGLVGTPSEQPSSRELAVPRPLGPHGVSNPSPQVVSPRSASGIGSGQVMRGSSGASGTLAGGPLIGGGAIVRPGVATRQTPPLQDAIAWAIANRPDQINSLLLIAQLMSPVAPVYTALDQIGLITTLLSKIQTWADWTAGLVKGFGERIQITPVGRLHLERLEMIPAGIEQGELVHSVPLAPKETVNISHKEWATTTQEFDQIVEDYMEGYSEQGVVEKNDLAHSTESESQHSNSLNLSATASGSYDSGVVNGSASVTTGLDTKSDDKQTVKDSITNSMALTRKASTRSKKDHKTSFKVASASGTEDQAVQVITNPSDTDAMRVDFYQLMRKWRVQFNSQSKTAPGFVANRRISVRHGTAKSTALCPEYTQRVRCSVGMTWLTLPGR